MFKWIIETPKRIITTHMVRLFWKARFKINGFKYYPIGGGEEVTLETQATTITDLEGQVSTLKESAGKGFYGGLSEEVRSNPSMIKFKDKSGEEVAKSYIELQSKISAKGVIVPIDGASEADISNFHKAIGRPDTVDGYAITLPDNLHKDIVSTAESQKVFKDQCHKIGLNTKQVQSLHSWYITELSNVMKQQDETDKKASDGATTALRSRWGTTYDEKFAMAVKVINKFGGEKAQEFLDKGLGNDPVMIEMFANIGGKLSEDALGPGGKSKFGGLTAEAAQAKIDEIRGNPKSAYNDSQNPLHKEAVGEMTALYQIITATEGT